MLCFSLTSETDCVRSRSQRDLRLTLTRLSKNSCSRVFPFLKVWIMSISEPLVRTSSSKRGSLEDLGNLGSFWWFWWRFEWKFPFANGVGMRTLADGRATVSPENKNNDSFILKPHNSHTESKTTQKQSESNGMHRANPGTWIQTPLRKVMEDRPGRADAYPRLATTISKGKFVSRLCWSHDFGMHPYRQGFYNHSLRPQEWLSRLVPEQESEINGRHQDDGS